MIQRLIQGGTKTLNSEKGDILILSLFLILTLTILFAGMIEFGRVMLVKEQLQTAADSAALAAAGSGTHRQVKINVVTDRGYKNVPCNDDEDCPPPCEECGTVTRSGIVGDEKDLLDNGDWRDYCVEPCDCGGGDCWYEIVDRDLMYDTYSMGTKMTPTQLNNAKKQTEDIVKETLPQALYENEEVIAKMITNLTLEEMSQLFGNKYAWVQSFVYYSGYNANCNYQCGIGNQMKCDTLQRKCRQCYEYAQEYYSDKAASKKAIIDRAIARNNKMVATNNKPVNQLSFIGDTIASSFFDINKPAHAEESGITGLDVYGYNKQNDPRYPSVVVYAASQIKTLFPQWFPGGFQTDVCAQGVTSFRDVDDQVAKNGDNKFYNSISKYGKWNRVPDAACE